jgi:L-galactose dehydrogenase
MPVAEARGVGVMNASPLAMGLFTNQGPQPWFPGQPEIVAACRKAAELCRSRGADISFLGMQFAYSQRRIPCTLTGASRKSELETNLKAMTTPIDAGLFTDVMKVLDPVRDWTWKCGNWKG